MSATPTISFEFFPPKTDEGRAKLATARKQLARFKPGFFSVTFGAGGTTREGTLRTVLDIRAEGHAAAPHLSCIGSTRDNIRAILDEETEQIWTGKKTAKEALDTAVARGNELLVKFQAANK